MLKIELPLDGRPDNLLGAFEGGGLDRVVERKHGESRTDRDDRNDQQNNDDSIKSTHASTRVLASNALLPLEKRAAAIGEKSRVKRFVTVSATKPKCAAVICPDDGGCALGASAAGPLRLDPIPDHRRHIGATEALDCPDAGR